MEIPPPDARWDDPSEGVKRAHALRGVVEGVVHASMTPLTSQEVVRQASAVLEEAWAPFEVDEIKAVLESWPNDVIVVGRSGFAPRRPPANLRQVFERMACVRDAADRIAEIEIPLRYVDNKGRVRRG